jgi:hypothetical protein
MNQREIVIVRWTAQETAKQKTIVDANRIFTTARFDPKIESKSRRPRESENAKNVRPRWRDFSPPRTAINRNFTVDEKPFFI